MWFLCALEDGQEKTRTLLRPGSRYTLGRKDADILPAVIEKTISRKHATLNVEQMTAENVKDIDWKPYVHFHDLGSKFGSSINSVHVEGISLDQGVYLNDGDTLKIGTKTGMFRLSWQPLIICRQALSQADRQKLIAGARTIGANVTQLIRSPYSHLFMSSIQMSFKVARCVAERKPIVSQKWLDTLVNLPDKNYTFPPVTDYLPPIDASCEGPLGVPDFTPNQDRARLFTGKRFIFFDEEQHQQLSPMIEICNGDSALLNVSKADPFDDGLGNDDTIVVDSEKLHETHAGKNIVNALDSFLKRVVTSMEICWAILYCSIDVQCNTKFNLSTPHPDDRTSVPTSSSVDSEPRNTSTKTSSASSSSAISERANTVISSSSSIKQKQPPQNRQASDLPLSKPIEGKPNMDFDLEDFFDQILGDEPSRPPPTAKNASPESSSTIQPPLNRNISDHQDHTSASDELAIEEQGAVVHHDAKKTIDKGKFRMHEPMTSSSYDRTPPSPIDDDIEHSSRRKSKKARTAKNASTTTTTTDPPPAPRKPYILPELENEKADITAGKNYTKVVYTNLVVAPSPPKNDGAHQQQRQQTLPQPSERINYKKFKKAIHPLPRDPLFTVGMVAGFDSDMEVEPAPLAPDIEDDFSEIRIRPNMKRGTMWN
ncbi:hypothetical protein BCR42DRAFT_414241 [Absidia repens]|uniref:FHA domain-containing protein n=1 Tax=Absidia repens TaxID=90262 RepID=A0A1X2IIW4_9FUNG|nr:hypothetical protein BCR42DRAFT_414241 [Absidia repens]